MKISTLTILAVITGSASAFVTPLGVKSQVTALNMAAGDKSKAVPFLKQPALLNGSMVGDVGFDPFDLAENPTLLENYREAEIRHCRIAMLGAAGWPLSELFDRSLANTFNLEPLVDSNDRAPSILNGGLGKISPYYWAFILGFAGFIEAYTIQRKKANPDTYIPGGKLLSCHICFSTCTYERALTYILYHFHFIRPWIRSFERLPQGQRRKEAYAVERNQEWTSGHDCRGWLCHRRICLW
jgi:hypothetical protein